MGICTSNKKSKRVVKGKNPPIAKKNVDIPDDAFKPTEAIIQSMTPYEKEHPECLNGSRRQRLAKGSGTTVADVNKLLKQFEQTRKMMKMAVDGSLQQRLKAFRR